MNLAFPHFEEINNYKRFLNIMDCLFLVDIIVNFFSAIEGAGYIMIDDRKEIAKLYLQGWFLIDVLAILPLDLIITSVSSGSTGNINSLLRVARIGKLYKLVKITRLVRLFKVIKQQGKIMSKFNAIFKISESVERLVFFIMIFTMLCHFMSSFWIFTGKLSITEYIDENGEIQELGSNWIHANEF